MSCQKDAWDVLKRHFERDTLANKLFLKKQYFRKEMSEGTPINEHLKEMKMLADKLASNGAPVSEWLLFSEVCQPPSQLLLLHWRQEVMA